MTSNFRDIEDLITSEMNNKEKQEIQDNSHENNQENENNSNLNQITSQQIPGPVPTNSSNTPELEKSNNQIENNSIPENNNQDPAWYIQVYEDKINNLKNDLNIKNNENNLLKTDNINLHNQLKLQKQSFEEYRKNNEKNEKSKKESEKSFISKNKSIIIAIVVVVVVVLIISLVFICKRIFKSRSLNNYDTEDSESEPEKSPEINTPIRSNLPN